MCWWVDKDLAKREINILIGIETLKQICNRRETMENELEGEKNLMK